MNLYVGNLLYQLTDEQLKEAFDPFGEVVSAKVIRDRESGRSRGFGFVEMPNNEEAQAAIDNVKEMFSELMFKIMAPRIRLFML